MLNVLTVIAFCVLFKLFVTNEMKSVKGCPGFDLPSVTTSVLNKSFTL